MTFPRTLCAAIAAILLTAGAAAQQPRDRDLDRLRGEIRTLRRNLEQLQAKSRSAEQELQEVELRLAIDSRELSLAVESQALLMEQGKAIEAQLGALSGRIEVQKRELSARLAALYRMGPLTYFRLIASMDTQQNPFQAASMLAYLVGRDARAVSSFQRSKDALAREQALLEEKRRQISAAAATVSSRQDSLERTRREKGVLLAKLQSEETQTSRKLVELEEKARRLENLFSVLYGRVDPNSVRRERIENFKGALLWPVRGRVVESFGKQRNPKFATVTVNNGLKIEASPGTEVRTIFEGTVLFSQWFRGYGNLIIVDHGNRIFSLYGNTMAPRVSVGDRVEAQQPIAVTGANDDSTSGFVYFEVREDNRPVDPRTWLR
jgi:murein hydrolase activator